MLESSTSMPVRLGAPESLSVVDVVIKTPGAAGSVTDAPGFDTVEVGRTPNLIRGGLLVRLYELSPSEVRGLCCDEDLPNPNVFFHLSRNRRRAGVVDILIRK